jgi:hypothetical protein
MLYHKEALPCKAAPADHIQQLQLRWRTRCRTTSQLHCTLLAMLLLL